MISVPRLPLEAVGFKVAGIPKSFDVRVFKGAYFPVLCCILQIPKNLSPTLYCYICVQHL